MPPQLTGRNQHKDCSRKNDQLIKQILTQYHHDGITDRKKISRLLKVEHGVTMSAQSTHLLPVSTKRQLVLDQLAQDPLHRRGPCLVWEAIMTDMGHLLMRQYVTDEMRQHKPDGFSQWEPSKKKVSRQPLVSLGPHHQWSGDGHNKLSKIGFPIWAIHDQWSGKWLGMWVVPNNQLKTSIAYLYLSLVYEIGGMPLQTTTDCGSETTEVYGFATALRSCSQHYDQTGWLRVRLQWGDNVKVFWEAGVSSNVAMALHKDYNRDVVKNLMVKIGGEDLVHFVDMVSCMTTEYSAHAQLIFNNLGFKDLTFQNVWPIFSAMLPLM
ncbi:hypothetical protein EDD22DRAFT_981416 [Suillus occidentalis]|nr:hypothetical protein EDD22DRAFT_981416 [Suillus occidentalis]